MNFSWRTDPSNQCQYVNIKINLYLSVLRVILVILTRLPPAESHFLRGNQSQENCQRFLYKRRLILGTSDTGLFTKVNRNLLKTGSLPAFFRSSIKTDVQLQSELVISKIPWTTLFRSEDSAIATLFNFGLVYTQCQGMLNSFLKEIRYNFYVNL